MKKWIVFTCFVFGVFFTTSDIALAHWNNSYYSGYGSYSGYDDDYYGYGYNDCGCNSYYDDYYSYGRYDSYDGYYDSYNYGYTRRTGFLSDLIFNIAIDGYDPYRSTGYDYWYDDGYYY